MTPKEKAIELFNKFYIYTEGFAKENAKKFALIAVDEILAIFYDDMQSMCNDELSYWHQVKQEIEKL